MLSGSIGSCIRFCFWFCAKGLNLCGWGGGVGIVPLEFVANQKRIRAVTTQRAIIIAGIVRSQHLLFDKRQGVRSRKPVKNLARTVPAKGLAMSGAQNMILTHPIADGTQWFMEIFLACLIC